MTAAPWAAWLLSDRFTQKRGGSVKIELWP